MCFLLFKFGFYICVYLKLGETFGEMQKEPFAWGRQLYQKNLVN